MHSCDNIFIKTLKYTTEQSFMYDKTMEQSFMQDKTAEKSFI